MISTERAVPMIPLHRREREFARERERDKSSLERCDDGDTGEKDHWQEAISENTHHTTSRHSLAAHQVQNKIHTRTPQETDTVDIAEMNLATLCVRVRETETE